MFLALYRNNVSLSYHKDVLLVLRYICNFFIAEKERGGGGGGEGVLCVYAK